MKVLLVNPPIYDFSAYDFWLRPYGLLRVAGKMRQAAQLQFFDFLVPKQRDAWGRGRFEEQIIPKPASLRDIPRHYRRFGRAREEFQRHLQQDRYDAVLIQTVMTFWVLGVQEVIEDIRRFQPQAKIVLGGVYATLCAQHAKSLGADFILEGNQLQPLWEFLKIEASDGLPFWDGHLEQVGILKITEGCPFTCSYCSVPIVYPQFHARPTQTCIDELQHLIHHGAKQVAFYDDALLFKPEQILVPFLHKVIEDDLRVQFHTPNALNARFITKSLSQLMVRAGFQSFFLGLESSNYDWQRKTGAKVYSQEFAQAVQFLREAGAQSISAYIIIGHPDSDTQDVEASMQFAHQHGVRVMLSDFAPIPGTPDGEKCRPWADLADPLDHNKTAFTIRRLGVERETRLKDLCRKLNSLRTSAASRPFSRALP